MTTTTLPLPLPLLLLVATKAGHSLKERQRGGVLAGTEGVRLRATGQTSVPCAPRRWIRRLPANGPLTSVQGHQAWALSMGMRMWPLCTSCFDRGCARVRRVGV